MWSWEIRHAIQDVKSSSAVALSSRSAALRLRLRGNLRRGLRQGLCRSLHRRFLRGTLLRFPLGFPECAVFHLTHKQENREIGERRKKEEAEITFYCRFFHVAHCHTDITPSTGDDTNLSPGFYFERPIPNTRRPIHQNICRSSFTSCLAND